MEFVREFKQLGKSDAPIAGGKGASLGEMTRAGVPVPPGFVVLSESFEHFLSETDLAQEIDAELHKVNHKEIHTVEAASEAIRGLILNATMPKDIADEIDQAFKKLGTKYVAVRSSATAEDGMDHAWAGQLESYLNTTEDDVLTKVKLCWSSLFTPRAIFYRFEKMLHMTKISVAVVVQKMVESEVSGIAFSVHPVTEDYNQLIIEAGFGLGEAIVSGSVTPDSYVVEKNPRRIIDINVSTQERALVRSAKLTSDHGYNEWVPVPEPKASSQVLTEAQIFELSEIILRIETHYGFPCDIEWAYEKGKFYIVQSRPITTLSSKKKDLDLYADISQDNYDFLWKVGVSYLFISMHYESGYSDKDFVMCHMGDTHMNFVGKEERKKLGEQGLHFYEHEYPEYERRITKELKVASKQIKELRDMNLSVLTNAQLAEAFLRMSKLVIRLWADYFPTEYHSADLVAEVLQHKTPGHDLAKIKTHVDQMARLKFSQRKILNETVYPPSIIDIFVDEVKKRVPLQSNPYQYKYLELYDLLLGKNVAIPDRSGYVVYGKFSNGQEVSGDEAKKIIDRLQVVPDGMEEIKGKTGNPGIYRGVVKKIEFSVGTNFAHEIDTMKKGQVLVSGSTGPEMILACEKAGAIVTDEGGIISHATIVSRELGIPSVIGTKIATKVLKDGDLVEVDADKGVVKILA